MSSKALTMRVNDIKTCMMNWGGRERIYPNQSQMSTRQVVTHRETHIQDQGQSH